MSGLVRIRNICPAGITRDVDLLDGTTFQDVGVGDVIEVSAQGADLLLQAADVWELVDTPKPKADRTPKGEVIA